MATAQGGVRPAPAIVTAERTLLTALLLHPSAFSHAEEDLGSLAFLSPELERLRQRLVEEFAARVPPGPDALAAALRGDGFGDTVDRLLEDPVLRRHRALGPDAPAEDLQALWQENLAVVRLADARADDVGTEAGASAADGDEALARRRLSKLAQLGEAEAGERD